jgi:hypothetical protein
MHFVPNIADRPRSVALALYALITISRKALPCRANRKIPVPSEPTFKSGKSGNFFIAVELSRGLVRAGWQTLAETLIRLVSRSARPDWPRSQVSLRLVSRHRSDTRLDKLKYFVQLRWSESHGIQDYPI